VSGQFAHPRRIAVFTEHFPPYLGSDRTVFELATRMAKRGLVVHFIVTQPLRYLLGSRPADWSYKENWTHPPTMPHPNVSAKYLLVPSWLERLWLKFAPLALLLTLVLFTAESVRNIRRLMPDLVMAAHPSPILGPVAIASARISRRPVMMLCPDWMAAYAAELRGQKLTDFGPLLLNTLEMTLIRLSDRAVAVTTYLRSVLLSSGMNPQKVVVLPNGADTTAFTPRTNAADVKKTYGIENRIVVLFAGHIEEWAGVDIFLPLAKRIKESKAAATIFLVGAGEFIETLLKKLSDEGLSEVLVYAGRKPFEDMPQYVAASDIALCIFPNTLVSHAASPLKLFEYMASGKAVVATRVSGTAEVMKPKSGILVNPEKYDELCDAVIMLALNEPLRISLGSEARRVCEENYSWDRLTDRLIEECGAIL
jgi:glycosyltransferase involved in cell wall biosynthesis